MRHAMQELGLVPDLILVSSARRTMQTMQALEPWDETPLVEVIDALYLANLDQLLSVLHGVPETTRSVLLIGHNPGLHELAVHLVDEGFRLRGKCLALWRAANGYDVREFVCTGVRQRRIRIRTDKFPKISCIGQTVRVGTRCKGAIQIVLES